MTKIFNLFSHLKSLPKKQEDELSLQLIGSAISEIINSPKSHEQRLAEIRLYLLKHNLFKRKP